MKKIYLQPSVKVVIFQMQNQLLSGSADPKFDPSQTTSTMESRGGGSGSLWDDEDYEDSDY